MSPPLERCIAPDELAALWSRTASLCQRRAPRPRHAAAPMAYLRLCFAWGFARLGAVERAGSERDAALAALDRTDRLAWLARATGHLQRCGAWLLACLGAAERAHAMRSAAWAALIPRAEVHALARMVFVARIEDALSGRGTTNPWPNEIVERLVALPAYGRYAAERLFYAAWILHQGRTFDPFHSFIEAARADDGDEPPVSEEPPIAEEELAAAARSDVEFGRLALCTDDDALAAELDRLLASQDLTATRLDGALCWACRLPADRAVVRMERIIAHARTGDRDDDSRDSHDKIVVAASELAMAFRARSVALDELRSFESAGGAILAAAPPGVVALAKLARGLERRLPVADRAQWGTEVRALATQLCDAILDHPQWLAEVPAAADCVAVSPADDCLCTVLSVMREIGDRPRAQALVERLKAKWRPARSRLLTRLLAWFRRARPEDGETESHGGAKALAEPGSWAARAPRSSDPFLPAESLTAPTAIAAHLDHVLAVAAYATSPPPDSATGGADERRAFPDIAEHLLVGVLARITQLPRDVAIPGLERVLRWPVLPIVHHAAVLVACHDAALALADVDSGSQALAGMASAAAPHEGDGPHETAARLRLAVRHVLHTGVPLATNDPVERMVALVPDIIPSEGRELLRSMAAALQCSPPPARVRGLDTLLGALVPHHGAYSTASWFDLEAVALADAVVLAAVGNPAPWHH